MGKASRDKGKRREREWCKVIRAAGYDAERTVQYSGRPSKRDGEPDVDSPDCPVNCWEVKGRERMNLHEVVAQARAEAGEGTAVAWKKNHTRWVVAMDAEDFFAMLADQ